MSLFEKLVLGAVLAVILFAAIFSIASHFLMQRGNNLARQTIQSLFSGPDAGDFKGPAAHRLISTQAQQSLAEVGDGKTPFKLKEQPKIYCQAFGTPCEAELELTQKGDSYKIGVMFNNADILFASQYPQ